MYICPTCKKGYATEEKIKKHCMICWKKANPHYKSKTASQGDTIITKEVSTDILNFFNSFKKREQHGCKS